MNRRSVLHATQRAQGLALSLVSVLLAASVPANAVTVTSFAPSTWPRTDAALGITGFIIEDFEDATLVDGLQVQLSGGTADFGPTGTLPHAFDPSADDPNAGKVLVPGIWDGTHVHMNRRNAPLPVGYNDLEWADFIARVAGGAASIGFSVQQLNIAGTMLSVTTNTGTTSFNLSSVPNFTVGGVRNGYLRIDAGAGERILSVRIDNQSGDGFAIDHLAFRHSASLVSHWKFDEADGTTAFDTVGAFDGTLAGGATFVAGGISRKAISLDEATGSLVDMGMSFPGFTTGDLSIVAWVKTTTTDPNSNFVSKHTSGSFNGYFLSLNEGGPAPGFGYGQTNKAWFYDSSTIGTEAVSTTSVNDGAWHQVVGVYLAGGNITIYVDGDLEATKTSNAIVANTAQFLVGGISVGGTPTANYTGLVDDVQVYRGALTDAQVHFLYTHPGQSTGGATIDFESVARGTVVTDELQAQGIQVSAVATSALPIGQVIDVVQADQDVVAFGASLPQAMLYGIVGDQLDLTFVLPDGSAAMTDSVVLRVGDGDAAAESFRVSIYTAADELLDMKEFTTTSGTATGGATAIFAVPHIHRVSVLGIGNDSGGAIDDLTFSRLQPVPTYDLVTDWSDAANPNGTWTYREGVNALPHVAAWENMLGTYTGSQPGWADSEVGTSRLPVWYQSLDLESFVHDFEAGDVAVHTTDDTNGVGNGNANVVWTSPIEGTVDVSGTVWMGREIGRSNDWFVYKNATLLSQGSIASGDAFSRANPFELTDGSTGPDPFTDVPVAVGDVIRLEFAKTSTFGDLVGVNLSILVASLAPSATTTTSATPTTSTTIATTTTTTTSTTTSTITTTSTSTITTSTSTTTPTTSTTTTAAPSTTTTTTAAPSTTTTTTLPPSSCATTPVGPGFVSLDCRLVALLARVNGQAGLANIGPKLVAVLQKALDRTREAGAFCRDGDTKPMRQRLKQATRALIQYRHLLQTRSARRKLDPAVRSELVAAGEPIKADLKTLRGAASCPDDAPPA